MSKQIITIKMRFITRYKDLIIFFLVLFNYKMNSTDTCIVLTPLTGLEEDRNGVLFESDSTSLVSSLKARD